MSVQIIIKRKWKINKPEALFPLFKELHAAAAEQPGYISTETLRSLEKPNNLMVISKWETVEDWEKWANTKERRYIPLCVRVVVASIEQKSLQFDRAIERLHDNRIFTGV